jgi:peptide/nickel transport system permease protein
MRENRKRFRRWENFKKLSENPMARAGLIIVLVFILTAIFAPWLAPYDPYEQDFSVALKSPSLKHLLGTDEFGRDILSRVIFGARPTFIIVVTAVLIGLFIGGGLGVISAFYGGKVDMIIMRCLDVLLAFPGLILALAIINATGPGIQGLIIAVSISSIPQFARVARGSVLGIKENDYIMAGQATGEGTVSIIFRYILPNAMMPIITLSALRMAMILLIAASLSFLGLGIQPPAADWGLMLSQGRKFIRLAPHLTIFPGIAIIIIVFAFNLLGDGLRDVMDVKDKG